jgi:hypothetical protein
MTNADLRNQVLTQLAALQSADSTLATADNTPSNNDTRQWQSDARSALNDVLSYTSSDSSQVSDQLVSTYNAANVKYKVFTSVYSEFGLDALPSFADALYESVKELPNTIGGAIGDVVDTAGNAGKNLVLSFFKSLGIWGWLLLALLGAGVAFYFFPQLPLMLRGLFYKKA